MTPKLAVFCSGNGSNFQALLDAAASDKLQVRVAMMVCDNFKAYAVERAHNHGVPTLLVNPKLYPSRLDYEKFVVSVLKKEKITLIALAGYMRILTPYFVGAFRGNILNIHPSLLPKFKGAHAIRDAFEAKEKVTGVTVHVVTEELDGGPILLQSKVKILPTDTLESLEGKIHALEHTLYVKAIGNYAGKLS